MGVVAAPARACCDSEVAPAPWLSVLLSEPLALPSPLLSLSLRSPPPSALNAASRRRNREFREAMGDGAGALSAVRDGKCAAADCGRVRPAAAAPPAPGCCANAEAEEECASSAFHCRSDLKLPGFAESVRGRVRRDRDRGKADVGGGFVLPAAVAAAAVGSGLEPPSAVASRRCGMKLGGTPFRSLPAPADAGLDTPLIPANAAAYRPSGGRKCRDITQPDVS